jgi:hypothetical protein
MSSQKKRPVALTAADRGELVRLTRTGVHPASMIRRAGVLLALDTSVGVVDPVERCVSRFLRRVVGDFYESTGSWAGGLLIHAAVGGSAGRGWPWTNRSGLRW